MLMFLGTVAWSLSEGEGLPVEVPPGRQDVGVVSPENRLRGRHGMDPVKHEAGPVAPVPVEADREVVVLAAVDGIEVETGPASLHFPGAKAHRAGDDEDVAEGLVPAELCAVLAKSFIDPVLAGQEVAGMHIRAADAHI